jgi:hypothetical protein
MLSPTARPPSGRGGPGRRPGGGRCRLPPGHQGPPRAEGAGPQGLHRPLRRPCTATRRRSGPWPWPRSRCACSSTRRTSTAWTTWLADDGHAGGPAGPDHLSHDEWAGIVDRARQRFPDLWMPNRSDLCFATTNRQAALKALAGRPTPWWSSARRTRPTPWPSKRWPGPSAAPGAAGQRRLELPDDLSGTVGVTAGASAPEALVEAVIAGWPRPRG